MPASTDNQPRRVIIRREEILAPGHHGGAWKIAYADFVTAMMAFFLVMWLINATTEQQRRGIANFFNPLSESSVAAPADSVIPQVGSPLASQRRSSLAPASPMHEPHGVTPDAASGPPPPAPVAALSHASGAPGILGGGGRVDARAQMRPGVEEGRQTGIDHPHIVPVGSSNDPDPEPAGDAAQLQASWNHAAEAITARIAQDPALSAASSGLKVEARPDGLRIELADSDRQPMFMSGAATPNLHAIALLRAITPFLLAAPGVLTITGHTDAAPYRAGSADNWTLSAQRADAARDVLVQEGFPDWRIAGITGRGAHDLISPGNPADSGNRRVVLLLARDEAQVASRAHNAGEAP